MTQKEKMRDQNELVREGFLPVLKSGGTPLWQEAFQIGGMPGRMWEPELSHRQPVPRSLGLRLLKSVSDSPCLLSLAETSFSPLFYHKGLPHRSQFVVKDLYGPWQAWNHSV